MKRIKILTIQFDNEILPYEIPKFRGAIIDKLNSDNLLFHNHTGDNTYRYSYPLIQYKKIGKCAAIICIDKGAESVHELFSMNDKIVKLGNREIELVLNRLNANQFTISVWDKSFRYSIYRWFPLNQDNHRLYTQLESEEDRIAFLERMLTGNILSFAKGIELQVEREIKIKIHSCSTPTPVRYKDAHLLAFDTEFSSNVFLPNYIGLGKGASHGFGTVRSNDNKSIK